MNTRLARGEIAAKSDDRAARQGSSVQTDKDLKRNIPDNVMEISEVRICINPTVPA